MCTAGGGHLGWGAKAGDGVKKNKSKFTKVHETCGKGVRSVWECILGFRSSCFAPSVRFSVAREVSQVIL